MSSFSQPYWIELKGSPFEITKSKRWPFLDQQMDEFPELTKLANSFLTNPTDLFSTQTSSHKGRLYLKFQQDINGYRGIWIPNSFPSLSELMKSLMTAWSEQSDSFNDWIQSFFAQRLDKSSLVNFQSDANYSVNIPPIFVLNKQQINGSLLHQLRSSIEGVEEINVDLLFSIIQKNLPPEYTNLIDEIYAENEISVVHLLRSYLHSLEMITMKDYDHFYRILSNVTPHLAEFILLNYLHHRNIQGKIIPDDIISYLLTREEDSYGMLKIMILRVITTYYKQQHQIEEQEIYLQKLMESAPRYSWNSKIDLINSQLGLSRCSVSKGDYFRAMTFYSFAKQGFSTIGSMQITEEMESEFQRISVLSCTQLMQHGLYLLNHNDINRNTFLILIDGIQSSLAHFIKYQKQSTDLDPIIIPLLQSATSSLKIYHLKVNELFDEPINFDDLIKTAELLSNPENRSQLVPVLQGHIEELSFKDQKVIERISVFSDDGRHIGDYHMKDGEFAPMEQNANQALFSSAMSAVSMLISEATESESGVEEISIGNKTVIYNQGQYITFCLIANSSNSNLRKLLNTIVTTIEEKYEKDLISWSGNLNIFSDLPEMLKPLSFFTIDYES